MTTIQLLYLYITKLYLGATGNQSSRSNIGIIEIELKESSPFGFDSSVEDSGTIEDIVEPPYFKVFVKRSGNFCRSILLVKYSILYSIYSFFLHKLVLLAFLFGVFEILPKSGQFSLPPPEDQQCTPSNLGLRLPNGCRHHK
ncbi:hypothetical protein F8M41_004781 [Gigaspora margarita]|uniref:Uncharacterized protein n=1 Tax=Gigaspora margarita TaxID=4874 RepID=A0A8H4AXF0_GIGMA|nr:hypothetical protein F8M41_004781 [Gigaspora margarita]